VNIEQADHAAGERGIYARHDDAAQLAEHTRRMAAHAL
jgi:hypothetical protein